MKEELNGLANHIAGAKGGLPQEWQDWANEIEMDLRKLANREAQPVAWRYRYRRGPHKGKWIYVDNESECTTRPFHEKQELFTAPPAPAVPNEMPDAPYAVLSKACGDNACLFADELWNACRAAMLAAAPEGGNG